MRGLLILDLSRDLPLRRCAAHRIQRAVPLPGDLPGMRTADKLA